MLDWLIVGGGVHGTHLSLALRAAGVASDRLVVVDPHEEPLEVFFRHVDATSMQYLRSPAMHHLALDPYGLKRFARGPGRRVARFFHPYDRPGLTLFREHVCHLVRQAGLSELRRQAWAQRITRRPHGFVVETSQGPLSARRVVLALGHATHLAIPDWADAPGLAGAHLFDPEFSRATLREQEPLIVVGGGISAAQFACGEVRRRTSTSGPVTIVARHAPRVHRFDSDPEWLGPRAMRRFDQERCVVSRRKMIQLARHRGSMPPEVHAEVRRLIHEGRLSWRTTEITSVEADGPTSHRVRLSEGPTLTGRLVLATGFSRTRPGGSLVDDAVSELGLSVAPCGFPLLGPGLAWAPGLHVSGGLAELTLGPSARNIAGARTAAAHLHDVAASTATRDVHPCDPLEHS
jgi:cation diffusion facilitator CzcD-associated flavoprotein CzcO